MAQHRVTNHTARYPTRMHLEFVVVAYSSSGELTGCLDSIQVDAPPGSKVVVVDNASPDDSATIAGSHPLRPRIVASGKNLGCGGGCTRGSIGWDAGAVFFRTPAPRLKPGAT